MDSIDVLQRLVGIDTTSRNPNVPLLEEIESILDDHGVTSRRVPGDEGKASLIARIGPKTEGGVVLCGHTDTVPVDGQPWDTDPFTLTRTGGRLAGRGTVDMKGFIACAVAAVPELVATDLRKPIILAFTHDEEVGCLGAPALAEALTDEPTPRAVIVGEPTAMRLVRGHKGIRVFRVTVTGKDAHSSQPQIAANANFAAARIVAEIAQLAEDLAQDGVRVDGFTPPHSTTNVGLLEGGQALNIVPRECTFTWEYRCVPGEDPDMIEKRIRAFATERVLPDLRSSYPHADVSFEVIAATPYLDPAGNADAAELVSRLTGAEESDPVAFGTDGSAIQAAGFPTVVIGPGQLDQMHQPNEAIGVGELEACDRFLASLAEWAATA